MSGRGFNVMKTVTGAIFPILATAIGVYVFIASFNLQPETRAFAGCSAFVLAILAFSVFVRDVRRGLAKTNSASEDTLASARKGWRPVLAALAWCVGFFMSALLIGFMITIPLWTFALLLWTRASRVTTFLIPILLWAIVKLALEKGLDTMLYKGILFGETLPTFW